MPHNLPVRPNQPANDQSDYIRPVAILLTFRAAANVIEDSSQEVVDTMDTTDHDILFHASRLIRIPPKSQVPVLVHPKRSMLMYVVYHERVASNYMEMMAREIFNVFPKHPCRLLVADFSRSH